MGERVCLFLFLRWWCGGGEWTAYVVGGCCHRIARERTIPLSFWITLYFRNSQSILRLQSTILKYILYYIYFLNKIPKVIFEIIFIIWKLSLVYLKLIVSKNRVSASWKTRPLVLFYYACRKRQTTERDRSTKRGRGIKSERQWENFSAGAACTCICIFRTQFACDRYNSQLIRSGAIRGFVFIVSSSFCRWFPFVHADKARS